MTKMVRHIVNSSKTCSDHSTGNAGEDNESDVESQDEGDLGHGARPGGGFISVVSIHPASHRD
jgi:hypothetical protein